MARYLIQAAYTPEAWAAQLKNPQDRTKAVQGMLDKLGGRIECFYYAFGASDIVTIADLPNNVSAAAISLAVNASGSMKSFTTTPLMTVEEGLEAMRKGNEAAALYRAPGVPASV